MKFYVSITISVLILVSFSCKQTSTKSTHNEVFKYYLLHLHRGEEIDTLTIDQVKNFVNPKENEYKHNILDSVTFQYRGQYVTIRKSSNYPNAWTDGEFIAFWEKSVGYFYWKSTTWRNFILLRTNNDSINEFIDVLLGNVLLDPRLFQHPGHMINPEFVPPDISDTIN